jgi:hypothetical protein
MNDRQNPFSFKSDHITVRNPFGSKWVYNLNNITPQNQFGFNPNKISNSSEYKTRKDLNSNLRSTGANPETISSKKCDQSKRADGPSKISSWPKGLVHQLSIAGERK